MVEAPLTQPPAAPARRRPWRGVALTLVALAGVAALSTYLTAPRPGGLMDPASTGRHGAHALVTLLREHGVEVVVAGSVADVEHAARPDTLLLFAQSQHLADDALLRRLAKVPADLLLVEPTSRTRAVLTPAFASAQSVHSTTSPIARCAKLIGPARYSSGRATPTPPSNR